MDFGDVNFNFTAEEYLKSVYKFKEDDAVLFGMNAVEFNEKDNYMLQYHREQRKRALEIKRESRERDSLLQMRLKKIDEKDSLNH